MEKEKQGQIKERSREEVLRFADVLSLMSRDYYARVNGRVRQVGWMMGEELREEKGGEEKGVKEKKNIYTPIWSEI